VEAGKQMGLNTVLAAMQILDQALSRMRYSTQARIIAELAIVRISHLADLDEISELIARLQSGAPATQGGGSQAASGGGVAASYAAAKKKHDTPVISPTVSGPANASSESGIDDASPSASASSSPSPTGADTMELTAANAAEVWLAALSRLPGIIVEQARQFDSITVLDSGRLVVRFKPAYAVFKSACERPEQAARFEQALADITGRRVRVDFALSEEEPIQPQPAAPVKTVSHHQRLLEVAKHPFVQRASELFGAQPQRVDEATPKE
jgi:DNA polymerase-3 subunit gamma/tau